MNQQYYSGGIAEIVDSPTPITFSFLQKWFSSSGAMGIAMKLLGLPYTNTNESVLAMHQGELVVDCTKEERMLYGSTILSYKKRNTIIEAPQQTVNIRKLLSPFHIGNTIKLIVIQSSWIAKPTAILATLKGQLEAIDTSKKDAPKEQLEEYINSMVMPLVIATGYVAEYMHQYAIQQSGLTQQQLDEHITNSITSDDWIFHAISDQYLVKSGTKSFDWYIGEYGNRADRDFELTCPRWHEMPETIAARIAQSTKPIVKKETALTETKIPAIVKQVIELQLLRTRTKQIALIFIDALRKQLSPVVEPEVTTHIDKPVETVQANGKGIPVSLGTVTGTILQVTDSMQKIPPNTIAVFPNASPEYSILFPTCAGIIFKRGGRTSHGAIVAREYGIPAIIEGSATGIKNGTQVTIDGTLGTWKLES